MFYDLCFILFYLVHFVDKFVECKNMHGMNNILLKRSSCLSNVEKHAFEILP